MYVLCTINSIINRVYMKNTHSCADDKWSTCTSHDAFLQRQLIECHRFELSSGQPLAPSGQVTSHFI